MWCACVRLTADQAGLQKIAEKFKKYDFSALLLVGGFEVSSLVSVQIVELLSYLTLPYVTMLPNAKVPVSPVLVLKLPSVYIKTVTHLHSYHLSLSGP